MHIRDSKRDKRQPNSVHDKDGNIQKYKEGFRDSMGRKQTNFFLPKYCKNDHDEAIRDIEETMIRYCDKNHLNWATVDKFALAKKLRVYKEYCDSLYGKRHFR